MAADDLIKTKKKIKKKAKKDKWGQPIVSKESIEKTEQEELVLEEEVEVEVEEQEEKKSNDGNNGKTFELNKVVVSGMPYSTTEDEIRDLFKDIGTVEQLQLSRFPDTGNFRGLAFVTFKTEVDAASSLQLDGTKMGNRFVKIERCREESLRKKKSEFLSEPIKVDGCNSAYVGNLSWNINEDDIRNFFEKSRIASIRFGLDKMTGAFRGFGHIDFEDDESLEEAMKKNRVELNGRPIKVAYAVANRN